MHSKKKQKKEKQADGREKKSKPTHMFENRLGKSGKAGLDNIQNGKDRHKKKGKGKAPVLKARL